MSGVHFIDGRYYVEVKRGAKIGDYVAKDGHIRTVTALNEEFDCVEFDEFTDSEGEYVCGWCDGYYKTLEPLEPEEVTVDGTQASEQVIEMLANLARRVTQLESQLRDTQRNVETWAEQTAEVKHMAYALDRDITALDGRTEIINAIAKFYEEARR